MKAYVRKSLTSSIVRSPVESRVRSAQLRGESSGASTVGEDRACGASSDCPAEADSQSLFNFGRIDSLRKLISFESFP